MAGPTSVTTVTPEPELIEGAFAPNAKLRVSPSSPRVAFRPMNARFLNSHALELRSPSCGPSMGRVWVWVWLMTVSSLLHGQARQGEIRLQVRDSNGHAMAASGVIRSDMNRLQRSVEVSGQGALSLRDLPFGVYRLVLNAPGFAEYSDLLEIHSAIPVVCVAVLKVQGQFTQIPVQDSPTLLDPDQTGTIYRMDGKDLEPLSAAGRGVIDVVRTQPGWLLEANGVLHPRGSEYDTQIVLDGLPQFDNRSPAFAPGLDEDELQSVDIRTSDFPAEYGRKLGGVVEVRTQRSADGGLHGAYALQGGSYGAIGGALGATYGWERSAVSANFNDGRTNRFLDPPVEPNYTNEGSVLGGAVGFDHELSSRDQIQAGLRYGDSAFLVPNELVQQETGQVQKRENEEISGRIGWQHVFSPNLLGNVQARGRDLSAHLDANDLSVPVIPFQERGFREGYVQGTLSGHHGQHDWKAGADAIFGTVHEKFAYAVTAPGDLPPTTPPTFQFAQRGADQEQSWFVQDLIRLGKLTVSAGLRWDHYRVVVDESGWSPRLGVAYSVEPWGLVLRGSYDRVFQTPAIENLLLASSPEARALNGESAYLPVHPGRGNYYDLGFAKSLMGKSIWNVSYFRREISNFSDDDLLLNTGVSFPIAFRHGSVYGVESKLEIPNWGPLSGYVGYSYMVGTAQLPVSGGLFLGDDTAQLNAAGRIPISQDQRNTANARIRYQVTSKLWVAGGATYQSGLPVDLNDTVDIGTLISQFGAGVVSKINFERGRVRPSATVDASAGYELWKHEAQSLRVQGDVFNLGGRLNVINFAGVFSGTALAPRTNFAVRLQGSF